MATVLRPNLIKVERRVPGEQSPTGSVQYETTTLNENIPAHLDLAEVGQEQWLNAGVVYAQLAMLIVDGLAPAQFANVAPGDEIVVSGITYTVSNNGLGAYPDIADGDRITDERGTTFLVMAVARYTVTRQLQAQIAKGKAWT